MADIKGFFDPVCTAFAYILYPVAWLWEYLMAHAPAAGLLAASLAGAIAILSILNNRATTRLRETFNTLNGANWDEDVIKARKLFAVLKEQYRDRPQEIARYGHDLPVSTTRYTGGGNNAESGDVQNGPKQSDDDSKQHEDIAGTLRTILNDYENQALGIRMNILDEVYAYRYLRGNVLRDWKALGPLVQAYRHRYDSALIYIEFEGLVDAWNNNRSFRTGKRIKNATKKSRFR